MSMRWWAAVLVASLGLTSIEAQPHGVLQTELRQQLHARLDATAAQLDGVLGYAIVDLESAEAVAARLADEPFPTASAIKLAVLYELLKQADEGSRTLTTPIALDRAQVVGGSGVLQHLFAPLLSLADHAALMMIVSDNTATNVLIDAVGMDRVNARMKGLGMADMLLRRHMMDGAAARRGDENVASPASLARIAQLLWRGDGLTADRREMAVQILYQVNGSIRSAVPRRVRVASKTGSLDGVRAEAAVVELDGRPFALAAMTTYLRVDADGDRAIREVADAAFGYFERLAAGGAYGRKVP
jgi:beta-lactamase class A